MLLIVAKQDLHFEPVSSKFYFLAVSQLSFKGFNLIDLAKAGGFSKECFTDALQTAAPSQGQKTPQRSYLSEIKIMLLVVLIGVLETTNDSSKAKW